MLHKNYLLAFAFVLMLFCLSNCTKENLVDPNVPNLDKELSKIVIDSANFSQLYYENGRVLKYEATQNGNLYFSISFSYDEKGKVDTEELFQDHIHMLNKYIYDDQGRIEKIELNYYDHSQTLKPNGNIIYQYDQENYPVIFKQLDISGNILLKVENTYDSKGNVIEMIRYSNDIFIEKIVYEYDNNINPLKVYGSYIFAHPISPNNKVKIVREDYQSGDRIETINNYTYDDDGYPVKNIINVSHSTSIPGEFIQEFLYN